MGFLGGPVDFLIHWPPGPVVATVQCQGLLRFINSHSYTTFSQCIHEKLSRLRIPATVLDTLYPLKMTPLPGYCDADHDRPRTRNTRPALIFVLKNLPLSACEHQSRVCHLGCKPEA